MSGGNIPPFKCLAKAIHDTLFSDITFNILQLVSCDNLVNFGVWSFGFVGRNIPPLKLSDNGV